MMARVSHCLRSGCAFYPHLQKFRAMDRVGDRITVMVEAVPPGGPALARSEYQAPEVDGGVVITRPHAGLAALRPGEFHKVVVTGAHDYDLVARLV